MADKLNRRTLGKTAGAVAGVAVAGRLASSAAQEATPMASPVAMEMVDEIVSAWPDVPREVAQTVMEKYGPPQEATPSRLIWFDNSPWKRTILYRDSYQHDFPMPHPDLLEQFIDYQAPLDTYDDLAMYDGSVIVERTKGEISARCDKEAMNFLAINLANDIATGERNVEEARQFYAETAMAFMEGESDPYVEGFVFEVPEGGTTDPDEPAM
ncbi:MAG: hypothetical protein M3451_14445 [Chloroflexota bacterium]|jgi:hypothetical protein|nr:hypothetical protein [Chloroflexota bacterium]